MSLRSLKGFCCVAFHMLLATIPLWRSFFETHLEVCLYLETRTRPVSSMSTDIGGEDNNEIVTLQKEKVELSVI